MRYSLVRLGAHLVDAAEGVEVVDIGRAEIDRQRLEDGRDRHVQHARLVAVDLAGSIAASSSREGGEHAGQARRLVGLPASSRRPAPGRGAHRRCRAPASWILKPPELPMPRTGGGGMAMMKASWMLCRLPNSWPMILPGSSPALSRLSKSLKRRKDRRRHCEALVKVAPEKPAKATASVTPGRLADDLRGALDHRIGARQRGAFRQLDDDDRIALVHGRDEAARHVLQHEDRCRRAAPRRPPASRRERSHVPTSSRTSRP